MSTHNPWPVFHYFNVIPSTYGHKRIRSYGTGSVKYRKLATKYPTIYGYFCSVVYTDKRRSLAVWHMQVKETEEKEESNVTVPVCAGLLY